MDRDDIIRKYNDKSTEEALKAHEDLIARTKKRIIDYRKNADEFKRDYEYDVDRVKREARAGHKGKVNYDDKEMPKQLSNDKVDYLNYLTKKNYEKPYGNYYPKSLVGDRKQDSGDDSYYSSRYYGKNGGPSERTERLKKYDDLKNKVQYAKANVALSSQGSGSYVSYKSDEEIEAQIKQMRDDLEKRIEQLKADNNRRKSGNQEDIERLKAREKELDDYLKSLGIRESVRAAMINKVKLTEGLKLNESKTIDAKYFEEQVSTVMESLYVLMREADDAGLTSLVKAVQKCYDELDGYKFISDNIYQKNDGSYGRIMSAKEARDSGIYDAIKKMKSKEN